MNGKTDIFVELERVKQENIFLKKKIEVVSEELNKKIAILEHKLDELKRNNPVKSPIQQDIIRKLNRNKKGIIKQRILGLIEERTSVAEVKDILVDRQNFCSKASFYRYVDELKREGKIHPITIDVSEAFL
jgi:DNA-binding transcriptional MerR regulator